MYLNIMKDCLNVECDLLLVISFQRPLTVGDRRVLLRLDVSPGAGLLRPPTEASGQGVRPAVYEGLVITAVILPSGLG